MKILEISPRPYLVNGDWCVYYTDETGESYAYFDDHQAAQDWINANRLSVKDALKRSLEV